MWSNGLKISIERKFRHRVKTLYSKCLHIDNIYKKIMKLYLPVKNNNIIPMSAFRKLNRLINLYNNEHKTVKVFKDAIMGPADNDYNDEYKLFNSVRMNRYVIENNYHMQAISKLTYNEYLSIISRTGV